MIDVILDLDEISLDVGKPAGGPLPGSSPVRWRYRARRGIAGCQKEVPFPRGWLPLIVFEVELEGRYGPFVSLTQILGEEPEEPRMEVLGTPEGSAAGKYEYFAVLYQGHTRGEEAGEDMAISLLSSPRQILETAADHSSRHSRSEAAPDGAEASTHRLEVVRDAGADQLRVEPDYTPRLLKGERLEWKFRADIMAYSFYPLVLFYKHTAKASGGRSAKKPLNLSFGPFHRLEYSHAPDGRPVIVGRRPGKVGGIYHYAAAALGARAWSISYLSMPDPQIDNEGEIPPPPSPDGT